MIIFQFCKIYPIWIPPCEPFNFSKFFKSFELISGLIPKKTKDKMILNEGLGITLEGQNND